MGRAYILENMVPSRLVFAWKSLLCSALLLMAMDAAHHGAGAQTTVEQRQHEVLSRKIAENPDPTSCSDEDLRRNCSVLNQLAFSLSVLYVSASSRDVAAGNNALQSSIVSLSQVLHSQSARNRARSESAFANSFRIPMNMLARAYFLFGANGVKAPDLLTRDNQEGIRRLLGEFAQDDCRIAEANPKETWMLRGSENIHSLHVGVCWGAAEILAGQDHLKYSDGSSPVVQREAWTAYLKEYIRQRAKFGGYIEFGSHYYKYTLTLLFNAADCSSNPGLRELAASSLDVWFADWAQEQVGGIHGGSKARVYFSSLNMESVGSELGWFYFGIGSAPLRIRNPIFVFMTTSLYRPPGVVAEIATEVAKRGSYEVKTRRSGFLDPSSQASLIHVDGPAGGILRYAYVTPTFIMGTSIVAKRRFEAWATPSVQNRWNGVVLADSSRNFILASPARLEGKVYRSIYNSEWGVQYKGTQIIQKLAEPYSRGTGPMALWFGERLRPERDGDWIFFDAHAYVAVRPAFGRLEERNSTPRSFLATEQASPIILHVSERADYASFAEFKKAVKGTALSVDGGAVHFRAPGASNDTTITFFYDSGELPRLNGRPVELTPDYVFDSPFMHARWGEGIVTIRFGASQIVRDFRDKR